MKVDFICDFCGVTLRININLNNCESCGNGSGEKDMGLEGDFDRAQSDEIKKLIREEVKNLISEGSNSVNIDENKASISAEDIKRLQKVEFSSQAYASFFATTMERDRSMLSLSVAGIGFLVAMINWQKDQVITSTQLFFLVFAVLGFLGVVFVILKIMKDNGALVIGLVNETNVAVQEYKLKNLDSWAFYLFNIGILFTACLGLLTAVNRYFQ